MCANISPKSNRKITVVKKSPDAIPNSKRKIITIEVYADSVKKLIQGAYILRECLNNGKRIPKSTVNDVVESILEPQWNKKKIRIDYQQSIKQQSIAHFKSCRGNYYFVFPDKRIRFEKMIYHALSKLTHNDLKNIDRKKEIILKLFDSINIYLSGKISIKQYSRYNRIVIVGFIYAYLGMLHQKDFYGTKGYNHYLFLSIKNTGGILERPIS